MMEHGSDTGTSLWPQQSTLDASSKELRCEKQLSDVSSPNLWSEVYASLPSSAKLEIRRKLEMMCCADGDAISIVSAAAAMHWN